MLLLEVVCHDDICDGVPPCTTKFWLTEAEPVLTATITTLPSPL
jgi:hypothetical protein